MAKQSKDENNDPMSFNQVIDVTQAPENPNEVYFPGDEPDDVQVPPVEEEPPAPEKKSLSEKAEEILQEEPKPEAKPDKPEAKQAKEEQRQEEVTEPEEVDESEIVDLFFSIGAERYDWAVDDEKKPKTAEELWDFLEEVVNTSSVPQYASPEAKEFDDFLRNGGESKKFMEIYNRTIDLDNANLEDENMQEELLREFYKEKKFKDEQISKLIHKAKQTDTIAEDAKEALDELKVIHKERKQSMLEQQRKERETQERNTQQFVSDIKNGLKQIDSLFGFNITLKDKEQLLPYVFEVGKDGKTQQQRDFEEDPVMYTILTSYAYANRDKLLKQIEQKGYSNATLKYKQKVMDINNKKKTQADKQQPNLDESDDMLNMV